MGMGMSCRCEYVMSHSTLVCRSCRRIQPHTNMPTAIKKNVILMHFSTNGRSSTTKWTVWQKHICIGHQPLTLSISQSTNMNGQYGYTEKRSYLILNTSWLKLYVANQFSQNGLNLVWNMEQRLANPSSRLLSLTLLLERDLRLNPVRFKSWWPIWLLDSWNLKTDL